METGDQTILKSYEELLFQLVGPESKEGQERAASPII